MGRLCGLIYDRQQLGGEGIEIELVPQAGGERLDDLCRVVATAVEAAVNRLLDAAAGRLEQGGHGQGGAGDGPARRLGANPAGQLPKPRTRPA